MLEHTLVWTSTFPVAFVSQTRDLSPPRDATTPVQHKRAKPLVLLLVIKVFLNEIPSQSCRSEPPEPPQPLRALCSVHLISRRLPQQWPAGLTVSVTLCHLWWANTLKSRMNSFSPSLLVKSSPQSCCFFFFLLSSSRDMNNVCFQRLPRQLQRAWEFSYLETSFSRLFFFPLSLVLSRLQQHPPPRARCTCPLTPCIITLMSWPHPWNTSQDK